jgi:shikimate dehydrogenase
MKLYGLIGYPLTHSFSKKYFTEKFQKENIADTRYELFEMADAKEVLELVKAQPQLRGLNVTIPHKEAVLPLLDAIDPAAEAIGAVNVIRVKDGKLTGYNSDYYGFLESLRRFLGEATDVKALILGTGGAAKAVKAALHELTIPYKVVSRREENNQLTYTALNENILQEYRLIVNTSPLGMYPNTEACPDIPYQYLTSRHFLYDLVYNPEETLFMKKGQQQGAKVINGLEMLHLQAEKAWEIWNK